MHTKNFDFVQYDGMESRLLPRGVHRWLSIVIKMQVSLIMITNEVVLNAASMKSETILDGTLAMWRLTGSTYQCPILHN